MGVGFQEGERSGRRPVEKKFWINIIFFLFLCDRCAGAGPPGIVMSREDVRTIAEKVFQNECSGKDECLMAWNDGEDFLSLGMGHFIWYPEGVAKAFEESFPEFLQYLKSGTMDIPAWLAVDPPPPCPWKSKEDFHREIQSAEALELRQLLLNTKTEQGYFIVQRFDRALPLMLHRTPSEMRERIRNQFYRVASSTAGIFAIIDYVNFKGYGTAGEERYQGKGWGLLQVLSGMNGEEMGKKALEEFVRVADTVLAERVKNAPENRKEEKWLPGWRNRLASYMEF